MIGLRCMNGVGGCLVDAEMPAWVEWCGACHADGYLRRFGDGQWQVCCTGCKEVGAVGGAGAAVRAWNEKNKEGVKHG